MSEQRTSTDAFQREINNIETTIVALEAQRVALGDLVVDTALGLLRERLATLVQPDQAPDERKRVTVLFADMSGYTALSENLDPEDVAAIMNQLFEAVTAEIHRFGGTIDKYSGDAVMALFGAPQALENHEEMAARAALAMQTVITNFSAALEQERGFSLRMRIGLNTGEVLAGLVGGLKARSYTVMGDTVNLASRLEHAAPASRILISAATARRIRAIFDFEPPQQIRVKGKTEPITVYLVVGEKAERGRVRGLAGLYAPMVGREAEFAALQTTFAAVLADRVWRATAVVGEAGIGKSRIRREFVAWMAETQPQTRILSGTGYPHTRTTPYSLLAEVMRSLFTVGRDVGVDTAVTQLSSHLHNLQPTLDDTEFRYQLGSLAGVLGLPLVGSPLQELDPEQRRDRTFLSLERILLATAAAAPLLLILDDLHWADVLSLAFLERFLNLIARQVFNDQAAMLLILSRPAEDPLSAMGQLLQELAQPPHRRLQLTALDESQSAALIAGLLDQSLPADLSALITHHAQGNPFFVEEMIRSFVEDGTLQEGATGRWRASRAVSDVRVPGSVQDIIAARLDRLPPQNKRVTQHAAIIGRTFWQQLLAQITQFDSVEPTLLLLETRQLADRLSESQIAEDWEWVFRHILIQEVAYATVPKQTRRHIHRQVAAALEAQLDEHTDFLLPLIAYHFEEGDTPDKAIVYLSRAGEQAAGQFANEEALGYFNRALGLLDGLAEVEPLTAVQHTHRYHLLRNRAEVYHLTGRRDAQKADLDALQALADSDGRRADVALKFAAYYQAISDFPTAVMQAKTAVTHAEKANNPRQKAEGLNDWAFALLRQGNLEQARDLLQQAHQLAITASDVLNQTVSLLRSGIVYYFQGENLLAREQYENALNRARGLKDLKLQSACLTNLVGVYHALGDISQARIACQDALQIVQTIGDRAKEAAILNNIGAIYYGLGNFGAAKEHHKQALLISETLKDRLGESLAASNLAMVLADLGDYQQASFLSQRALQIDQQIGDRIGQGYSLTSLARALEGLGELTAASQFHQEAIKIRRDLKQDATCIDNLAALAAIAVRQNDLSGAQHYVDAILIWIEANGTDGIEYLWKTYLICITVLETVGAHERANILLNQTYHSLIEQAQKISDPDIRHAFLHNVLAQRQIIAQFEQKKAR
ncbi:MAG: tetratricopeptide repeat protein [Chloroflexi bacterium]|nr:tetratricopeptide repeat protein [Chloroflexota bacterium]